MIKAYYEIAKIYSTFDRAIIRRGFLVMCRMLCMGGISATAI